MYTTLDYLDKCIKQKKKKSSIRHFFNEIKTILVIFVITFVGMLLFTNAQVFFSLDRESNTSVERNNENIQIDNTISKQVDSTAEKKLELENLLSQYDGSDVLIKQTTDTLQESLEDKMKSYSFDFNTVPPTDRLIISKIDLDVPIINSQYKKQSDFTQGNFDAELENGVVKYPTTPEPGKLGNTLIFGHTSQEWRKKNPYGTVFSKIPNLEIGDEFTVIWGGKLYKYRVIEKIVVSPKNVDAQYKKYQNGDYLTLMGCYPIGRTDKRMMITAEIVNI